MSKARPQLKPALRRVWRDRSTLQLGLDPAHAVVISGLDPGSARLIETLDGTRDLSGVTQGALRLGLDRRQLDELLALLARAGVLEDGAGNGATHAALAELSRDERDRLGPDVAAASLVRRGSGDGPLARRRRSVVQVVGAGRVGAAVVTLLASAGVGAVVVDDAGITGHADVGPAALAVEDVGVRRQEAAVRAARRVAPSMRSTLPSGRRHPDLTVIASGAGVDPGVTDRLLRAGVPHLVARVRETTGVVGPLVLPGRSSCHRCHELHRSDRDPAWPGIAAQLLSGPRHRSAACDTVLATAVAAHTALQVLAFLDGDPAPPSVDGTLEIAQSDGSVRRRSWAAHPLCGCQWARRPA